MADFSVAIGGCFSGDLARLFAVSSGHFFSFALEMATGFVAELLAVDVLSASVETIPAAAFSAAEVFAVVPGGRRGREETGQQAAKQDGARGDGGPGFQGRLLDFFFRPTTGLWEEDA